MSNARKKPSRLFLYGPFVIAGVIVLGYYLLWRASVDGTKDAVLQWVADQEAAGLNVSHGELHAEGFPFFLRVHVEDPLIESPGTGVWRTERLTIDALPYDLHRIIFSIPGAQEITTVNGDAWHVRTEDFRVSLAEDKATAWKLSASIATLNADRTSSAARVNLASLVFDLAPAPDDQMKYVLSLDAHAIGGDVDGSVFKFDRIQTVSAATYAPALPDLNLWRYSGGAIEIAGLIAEIDKASLSCAGVVSLDDHFYPQGRLNAEMIAPAVFANALADAGIVSRKDAETAGAALTLTAIANGGKITAPIELKGGDAKIAGVKIADLPQLN